MNEQPISRILSNGRVTREIWYLPSKGTEFLHREDGPAYTAFTKNLEEDWYTKMWYVNNKRHRMDGPAYIGYNIEEWWINGEFKGYKEIPDWIKENNIDLSTEEGQVAFKLRWM